MTIDEHMDIITFWEPYNGKIYNLREQKKKEEKRISDKYELKK